MFPRLLIHLFTLLFITSFLTGCLGGGGGSETTPDNPTSTRDARVATVKVIISNDFQPADGKSAVTITVIAQNAQNAPVAGIPVSLFSSSDTAFLEVLSGLTEETGRFTTTVTDSVAEEVQITATAGGVKSSPVNLHFVSSAYDPRVAKLELVVANDFQLADGKSFMNFTVVVRDASNTPIPNVQVSLGSASNSASFESVSGKTAQNGRFSTTVTNSVAEKVEVTATAGGKTERTLLTFVSVVNDERVAEVKLTVGNNYQYADGFSKVNLTVIAIDHNGMPLSGVGVSFSSTSASAVFEAFKGRTDDAGRFSTTVTNSIPETFQVTANAGGVRSLPMDVTFTSTVGSIFINASAQVLNVGDSSQVTVTLLSNLLVNIEDLLLGKSLGEFLTDPAVSADTEKAVLDALLERKVLLPQTPFNVVASGTATLSGVTGTTDERGQATFTVSDNTAEDVTLTITSGTASQTLILHFGASLTLIPTAVNAIGTTKLKVLLRDGKKAPLGGQNISFNFNQVTNETLSPVRVVSTSDGTAEVTVTDLGNDGGTVIVNAYSGSLNAQATINFLASQDALIDERVATVKVIISDDFQPADGKSLITVTVIAQDAKTAPVVGIPVSLFSSSDTAFFAALSGLTEETGRFTTTVTDSVAEEVKITATAGGIKSSPVSLHFVSSAYDTRVAKVELVVTNDSQMADGKSPITLTAMVRDASNMPIPKVQVYLGSTSNSALFQTVSGETGENGRFTTTVTDTVAEKVEVTATAGGVKAQTVLTFVSGASDERVSEVKLTVSNNRQRADGFSKATLTVVVLDQNSLPMSGVAVSFSSTSPSAFLEAVNGVTDEKGRFSTTVTDNVAEEFEVTATAGGKSSNIVKVIFIADVGVIVLNASEVVLETSKATTITVTILRKVNLDEVLKEFRQFFDNVTLGITKDALDTLLEQKILLSNMPFTVTTSSATAVLSSQAGVTDSYGQARFTVTNSQAEDVTITVTSGAVSQTLLLHFGATLTLIPSSVNAIGNVPLKVLLRSGNKTPLGGYPVTFNFNQVTNETLSPTSVETGPDGTAEVTITDLGNDGGTVIVNANSGSLNAQATVNFLADIGQNRKFEVTSSATVLKTGPGQFATLTATVTDNVNVPVAGTPIHFSLALTGGGESHAKILETQPANGLTGADGKVQVLVTDDVGENVMVIVQAGTATQKVPLYFGATANLLPKDTQATADGTTVTLLTASVNDASGAGIGGVDVNFRTASKTALLDNYRVTTNSIGQATIKVINTVSEMTVVEAQAGNLAVAKANINFSFVGSGLPSSITLKTQPPEPVSLSLNGIATITATVLDSQNNPVKDGTRVNFSTNGVGTITEAVFTRNGQAPAIFSAGTTAGLALVTATAEPCAFQTVAQCTSGVSINVQPGKAGIIEIAKIEPQIIGIKGSGVTQSATIQFLVKDSLGNPVADGTAVEFSLGNTTLGGNETITTGADGEGKTAQAITTRGLVSVTLKSGIVAGNADVVATVVTPAGNINTVARVTIVGSLPDADHLSLAVQYLNIAGGVTFGLEDTITAYVGDRFGNVVPDGTSVSFITEGGTIGKSVGGTDAAFTTTTTFGQATAVLQSAGPTTPMLGGIPTLRKEGYQCEKTYTYVLLTQLQGLCGNPGGVTFVAYTTGSESFVDTNGNGQFDVETDRFSHPGFIDANGNGHWDINEVITNRGDMSEPYLDGNDNQTFDPGELYIDVNNNGRFEGPDGIFQSNTTVWQSGRVLFSAPTAPLIITPWTFSIPNGGVEIFTVTNISDLYGNPLVKGSKLEITTNNGVLGGATEWTFGDSGERGESSLLFTLASNPAKLIVDKDKDGNETSRLEYPPPETATVTVKISSPVSDKTMGGNGDVTVSVSGGINVR